MLARLRAMPRGTLTGLVLACAVAAGALSLRNVESAELWAWLLGDRFLLRDVEVLGSQRVTPETLVASAGLAPGTHLFDVDVAAVVLAMESHPRVAAARGARLPPDRLIVEVVEREPVAALADSKDGIDLDGHRFALVADETGTLPVLHGETEPALPLLRAAHAGSQRVAEIRVAGPRDVRARLEGEDIWLRFGRDPARALEAWQRLGAEGVARLGPKQVDLRFSGSAVLTGTDQQEGVR